MDIKRCPFCNTPALAMYGAKADDVFGGNRITLSVGCATCGVSFKKTIDGSGLVDDLEATINELVGDWNRRA